MAVVRLSAHSLGALWQATSCEPWRAQPRCVVDRCFEALWVEGRHTLDPPQTLDLAIIRLLATSAHAFIGKSRLDSRWPGAIYTPWFCVEFGGRRKGQEATAKNQRQGPPINVNGFSCRHEGRRHAHLAPRAGSTRRGAAPAPGAQASTMPRRLYAERRLLHPAVAQRAAVDRKAWIGPTKPADSEKNPPALSIPPTRVSGTPLGHA